MKQGGNRVQLTAGNVERIVQGMSVYTYLGGVGLAVHCVFRSHVALATPVTVELLQPIRILEWTAYQF
jgi:hypothetical protein